MQGVQDPVPRLPAECVPGGKILEQVLNIPIYTMKKWEGKGLFDLQELIKRGRKLRVRSPYSVPHMNFNNPSLDICFRGYTPPPPYRNGPKKLYPL